MKTYIPDELCRVDGCMEPHDGRPLCHLHWVEHFAGRCLIDGCAVKPAFYDFLCEGHRKQWRSDLWSPPVYPPLSEVAAALIRLARSYGGVTVRSAAIKLYRGAQPTERQRQQVRHEIDKLVEEGVLARGAHRSTEVYWVLPAEKALAPAGSGRIAGYVPRDAKFCEVANCGRPQHRWRLCEEHHATWRASVLGDESAGSR